MIPDKLQDLFISKNLTFSTAESCTGGAMAACITGHAGSSQYYLGGIIAYSNDLKTGLLNVSRKNLEEHGAVSKEVVLDMVQGLLKLTKSDYGIAVSGIAGPTGGTIEKPVGTIWAAISRRGHLPIILNLNLTGDRSQIIAETVRILLQKLQEIVESGKYS